jgi:3-oxoacyl-[acyl-carrier-protein] synthase-3
MSVLYGAEVIGLGRALPKKVLTNADLEKMVDTNDEWIVSRSGIRSRHIISGDETVSGLAVEASKQAMERAGVTPEEIDLIVMGTFTADHLLPSSACLVQDKLGAINAGAFDINSACTGFIYSLITGAQYVKTGSCRTVLVIGADAVSTRIDWTDRNTCVLFGDGASALVLRQGSDPTKGVQSDFNCTKGSGMSSLHIWAGGSAYPISHESLEERTHYVNMSGKEVYKFAIQALVGSARKVMEADGISPEQIKLMVPHQANLRIIESAAVKLGFSKEQVFTNIDKYGNTVGASVGIALEEAWTEGRLDPGDKVLVVGFGAGLSWGALTVNWTMEKP